MSPLDRLFDQYNESMTPQRARDEMFAATAHYSDLPPLPACRIINEGCPYQYSQQGTSNLRTGNAAPAVADPCLPGQGNNWALARSSQWGGDSDINMPYHFWNPTSMLLSEDNAGFIPQQNTNNQACRSLGTGNDFGVADEFCGSTSEVHAQNIAADDLAIMTSNSSINLSHGADNSIVPTYAKGINSYSQATLSVSPIHGLGKGSLDDDIVRSYESLIQWSRKQDNISTGLARRSTNNQACNSPGDVVVADQFWSSTSEVHAQILDAGNLAIMTGKNPTLFGVQPLRSMHIIGSRRGSGTGDIADTNISPTSGKNFYSQATLSQRSKGNISTGLADTNTIKRSVGRPKGSTKANRQVRPPTSLKTVHLSLHSIQIGNWERKSKTTTDLLAKCYFGKRKLMWEFLSYDTNLKSRIEVKWKYISSIKIALSPQEDHELLHVELSQPPGFGRETNVTIKRYSPWGPCNDFTDGQASIYRIHNLAFKRGCLFDNFSKMLERSEVLRHLNMKPFPTHPSDRFV